MMSDNDSTDTSYQWNQHRVCEGDMPVKEKGVRRMGCSILLEMLLSNMIY